MENEELKKVLLIGKDSELDPGSGRWIIAAVCAGRHIAEINLTCGDLRAIIFRWSKVEAAVPENADVLRALRLVAHRLMRGSCLDARGMAWKERCVDLLRHPDGDGIQLDAAIADMAEWSSIEMPSPACWEAPSAEYPPFPEMFSDAWGYQDVALRAVSRLKEKGIPISVQLPQESSGLRRRLRFTAAEGHLFRFWQSPQMVSLPRHGWLHLLPPYHPAAMGRQSPFVINGDTSALIARHPMSGIDGVSRLAGSIRMGREEAAGSWSPDPHPFVAASPTLDLSIDGFYCRSERCIDELERFLSTALDQDPGAYVEVSAGSRVPEDIAHGLPREQRGSEHHCVWEYHTLAREGVLAESLVPSWLLAEGWIKPYPDLP
jgi:hypothetical protein